MARRATSATVGDIEEQLGLLFFIRNATAVDEPMPPMQTGSFVGFTDEGERTALVIPLRRRPENEHAFISIGRLDGNDITIAHASVSKFHAYVKQQERSFALQDARSRNGTTLDGVPVPARGGGGPVALKDGQHIKLGAVELTCASAARLLDLLRRRAAF